VIESQSEHVAMVRQQMRQMETSLGLQEKLCLSRHRLALTDFPNWVRWATSLLVATWLSSGVLVIAWLWKLDKRVDEQALSLARTEQLSQRLTELWQVQETLDLKLQQIEKEK
jgi:hypothetical protein